MSDKDISYGTPNKRIVFTDTEHRHAKLIIRLRHDGLRQSEFFRNIITGYIDGNEHIQEFVDSFKPQSIKRKSKSRKDIASGTKLASRLALDEDQIENIFDLIAEEHPEL